MRPAGIAIVAIAVALTTPIGARAELAGRVAATRTAVARTSAVKARTASTPVADAAEPVQHSHQSGEDRRQLIAARSQSLLEEQLNNERGRQQKLGQDSADDAMRLATEEAAKISDQAEDDIATVRMFARGYGQQALVAEITEDSRRRQLAVRCTRQAEANQHLGLAEKRAQALEQTAKTLADEMTRVRSPGGFGLTPVGSNLYVRNYSAGR